MKTFKILSICAALIVCCSGFSSADQGKDESGKGRKHAPAGQYQDDGERGSYFHRHGYTRLNIPEGHYPPPGECRIWYPGKPAGHQPPPGPCNKLRSRVPAGAWLISRPEERPERVHVTVCEDRRRDPVHVTGEFGPDSIQVTGEFEIETGNFLRVVIDK